MSLLTSGGKSLGIGSDCTVDDNGHTHSTIYESGNKHGSFRGRGQLWPFSECLCMGKLRSILGDLGVRSISWCADVKWLATAKWQAMLEAINTETGPPL